MEKTPFAQYYYRLYTLDSQVRHLDDVSLLHFGHWLSRKWMKCQERRLIAVSELEKLNIPEKVLRSEWQAQVREQMKPIESSIHPYCFCTIHQLKVCCVLKDAPRTWQNGP